MEKIIEGGSFITILFLVMTIIIFIAGCGIEKVRRLIFGCLGEGKLLAWIDKKEQGLKHYIQNRAN